jgi:uncharacterized protein YraI
MKRLLTSVLLGTCLLAATSAFAYDGYVTGNVSLRAGPDSSYPTVVRLRAGTPVEIEGCVDDWAWCDVSIRDDRGWVSGAYLQEEYQGRRVLVRDYGVRIGLPIIAFAFGDYWDNHYRGRSWYGSRDRWSRVHTRYYSGGSYGHSGGSRSSYGGTSRDTQHVRSGDYSHRSGSVTTQTQPTYQTHQRSQPAYRADTTRSAGPRSSAVQSRTQQTQINSAAPAVHNANPQRSVSGQVHSAGGQARAAEVHQRNADRAQQRGNDKSDGGRGGRKDKEKNNDGGKGQH